MSSKEAVTELISTRSCGGCTACCKTHAVVELDKEPFTWCKHCNIGEGCSIYGRHPTDCKEYFCFWRKDARYLTENDRPDRLKVVIDHHRVPFRYGRSVAMVIFREVESGAMEQPRVKEIKAKLSSAGCSVTVDILFNEEPRIYFADFCILSPSEKRLLIMQLPSI